MTASVRATVGDLSAREFDLLVIGGGITGAGILRDAAMRGLTAALVDQGDFAAGTSSRSSRLIHGGLRYLEHRQWRLVFEALRERAVLLRLAPHLVRPLQFVFPVFREDRLPRWKLALGLGLYGLLAAGGNVTRPRMFGKAGLLRLEPNLRVRGLAGGGLYGDAQCDDARLVIATIRSALAHGALAANYVEVTGLVAEGDRLAGVETHDRLSGTRGVVRARAIVNATGPWTDALRRLEDPDAVPMLRLTSGAHIVVPRARLGHTHAITFTSPIDGRVMFVLPWGDQSYVGTTDTDFGGDPARVETTAAEIEYLLRSVNSLFPHAHLEQDDVISTWAGVRALLAGDPDAPPSSVSREHRITVGPRGMITIAGGKLTTYRSMAAEVVDRVVAAWSPQSGRRDAPAPGRPPTDTEPLPGGESSTWDTFRQTGLDIGLPPATLDHLVRHYGTETAAMLNLIRSDCRLRSPIHPSHPALAAEVVHAVRRELAVKVDDVLARRLHLATETTDGGRAARPAVAEIMGRHLGWDADRVRRESGGEHGPDAAPPQPSAPSA